MRKVIDKYQDKGLLEALIEADAILKGEVKP